MSIQKWTSDTIVGKNGRVGSKKSKENTMSLVSSKSWEIYIEFLEDHSLGLAALLFCFIAQKPVISKQTELRSEPGNNYSFSYQISTWIKGNQSIMF